MITKEMKTKAAEGLSIMIRHAEEAKMDSKLVLEMSRDCMARIINEDAAAIEALIAVAESKK